MRHVKKFVSILLALTMVFVMSTIVFATGTGEKTEDNTGDPKIGSITINNAIVGSEYKVYKILDIEGYNNSTNLYTYKVTDNWINFFESDKAKQYVDVDTTNGSVTWKEGTKEAEFAEIAKTYITDNSIQPSYSAVTATGKTVVFDNLALGYYLIDSSKGTICTLHNVTGAVELSDKNVETTNVKTVEENSTGNYGENNDANVGDTVKFKSTINVQNSASSYVFHDKMSDGLTFDANSVKIKKYTGGTELDVSADQYAVRTSNLGHTSDSECTFHIIFEEDFVQSLKIGDKIEITYEATLNDKAVVRGEGNTNTSYLVYDDKSTAKDTTRTYSWGFSIFKYTKGTGSVEIPLADAEFILYKEINGSKKYAVMNDTDSSKFSKWVDDEQDATKFTSNADGSRITINGLDAGTYFLEETKAPEGYNPLRVPVKVIIGQISDGNKGGKVYLDENNDPLENNTVKIENKKGNEMPGTGGIGTTIFYVLGAVLVIGAAVLLVVRRRMSAEK